MKAGFGNPSTFAGYFHHNLGASSRFSWRRRRQQSTAPNNKQLLQLLTEKESWIVPPHWCRCILMESVVVLFIPCSSTGWKGKCDWFGYILRTSTHCKQTLRMKSHWLVQSKMTGVNNFFCSKSWCSTIWRSQCRADWGFYQLPPIAQRALLNI